MFLLLSLLACTKDIAPGTVVLAVNTRTTVESERYTILRGGRFPAASPTMNYYTIPSTEQKAVWCKVTTEGAALDESISFAGKDGQNVNVDIGVGYRMADTDEGILALVGRYGPNFSETVASRIRDTVRDALNTCAGPYTVEGIYGEQKSVVKDCALEKVRSTYGDSGIVITYLAYNSEIRLPDTVRSALEGATAAVQKGIQAKNEVASTQAEGEKAVAEAEAKAKAVRVAAEAQAYANGILAKSLTHEVVELRRLEVQEALIQKWDGRLPQNTFGDATPLITLPSTASTTATPTAGQ